MPTSILTQAQQRLDVITTADNVFMALVNGKAPSMPKVADGDAPAIWEAVAQRLKGYESGRHARRADAGLVDLNSRLLVLLGKVRSGALSAAEAMSTYRGIRQAQQVLSAAASSGATGEVEVPGVHLRLPLGRLLQIAGVIANIDEMWPDWRNKRRGNRADPPPWDHDEHKPLDILPTEANLRWLATSGARAWVPTVAQAAQAAAEQTQAEEARMLATSRAVTDH